MIQALFNREWLVIPRYFAHGEVIIPIDPEAAFVTPYGFCVPLTYTGQVLLDAMRSIDLEHDGVECEAILINHLGQMRRLCGSNTYVTQIPVTSLDWVFHLGDRKQTRDHAAAHDYLLKGAGGVVEAVEKLNLINPQGIFDPYYFRVSDIAEYLSKNGHTKLYPITRQNPSFLKNLPKLKPPRSAVV